MPSNALVLEGDSGERRLTRADLEAIDAIDLELLQVRIDDYIARMPGLQVQWSEDIQTRDILIRWRTRP